MSQAEKLAKTARENLAAALNALQTSTDVPPQVLEVADIIAQCMGVLHRIERTQGADLTGKEVALESVRKALDYLQGLDVNHPTLDIVLEKVAGSLTSVRGLARLENPAPAAAAPPAAAVAPAAPAPAAQPFGVPPPAAVQPVVQQAPTQIIQQPATPASIQVASAPSGSVRPGNTAQMPNPAQPAPQGFASQPAPVHPGMSTQVLQPAAFPPPQPFAQQVQQQAQQQAQQQPTSQPPRQAAPQASPATQVYTPPAAQPQPGFASQQPQSGFPQQGGFALAGYAQPGFAQSQQAVSQAPAQPSNVAAMQAQNAAQARHETARIATPVAAPGQASAPAAAGSESGNVVVELGTHSVSNFYKGLGGNDVVEHGGLFVATYRIPKLGTNVKLRVLLPGDLEFIATGVVQWIRDPHSGGESSEPGFGARLTQITPEGRQLVYRYTRNREPMFYDDL